MPDGRLSRALDAYVTAFDTMPPRPFGAADDYLADVLEAAVKAGEPVQAEFDWWADLPPGSVA